MSSRSSRTSRRGWRRLWAWRSGRSEEKRLSEKPTQNLRRLRRLPQGRRGLEEHGSQRSGQPAQGARFLRAGRGARPRLRAGLGAGFQGRLDPVRQQRADARARRARPRRQRRRPSHSRQTAPTDTWRSGTYMRVVASDFTRALEQYAKGRRVAPGNADLLRATALDRDEPRTLGRRRGALPAGREPRSPVDQQLVDSWHRAASSAAILAERAKPSTGGSLSRPPTSP